MGGKVVLSMIEDVRENQKNWKLFGVDLPEFKKSIPRIKMRDAQEIIFKRTKSGSQE